MSGFAGVISLDGAPPDRNVLERMAQTLAFRGPDGTHITTKPGAGFCFTFLRTGPAPQCTSQPCSLDGRVWLLGDVRLDGRDDLIRKLEQHGDKIDKDATDEELVLCTWRLCGEEGIAGLIGDYAFALWNTETQQLRCWRDLMGARPLFFARADSWFYFSNTLNAIRRAPQMSDALDDRFIGGFLLHGWCSDLTRSAFRDIARLRPGYTLTNLNGELHVRCFASMPIEEPLWLKHEAEYVEQFRGLLKRAVLERLPKASTAIFMSGGLDSTSVAAVAVHTSNKEAHPLGLRAFTVDYRPLFDDGETTLTSLTAEFLGIPLEIVSGASCLPYESWDDSPPHMPEPFHDPLQAIQVEKFRRLARHSRIALNGYGGDGIMTGQSWPYLVWLLQRGQLARVGGDFGGYILRYGRFPPLRAGLRSTLTSCFKRGASVDTYPQWLSSQFKSGFRGNQQESLTETQQVHPWYPLAYDTFDGSWAGVLEAEDAAWTGMPVESRAPFLDQRLLRFLLRVPPVPLCVRKEILRRTMRGLLPEQVRLRPKRLFTGDLIGLHMAAGRWKPLPILQPSNEFSRFVNWRTLEACLERAQDSLWTNLRPISLLYWLRLGYLGVPSNGATYEAATHRTVEKNL
jgi:asparagine synthase (glutamine-hydrolysing)